MSQIELRITGREEDFYFLYSLLGLGMKYMEQVHLARGEDPTIEAGTPPAKLMEELGPIQGEMPNLTQEELGDIMEDRNSEFEAELIRGME